MKRTFFILITVLLFFGTLTACKQNESKKEQEVEAQAETQTEENIEQKEVVKEVIVHAAPEGTESPSDAIVEQFEVVFENGESRYPKMTDVISETTLGNKSILTIHSPEGENHYAIFLYEKEEKLKMRGMIRTNAIKDQNVTNESGLALPVKAFSKTSVKLDDNGHTWAFVNQDKVVTISKFDRFPFEGDTDMEEVNLEEGVTGYLSKDEYGNESLYYVDRENLIVLSGNLDRTEAIDLANSLPASTNVNFPG